MDEKQVKSRSSTHRHIIVTVHPQVTAVLSAPAPAAGCKVSPQGPACKGAACKGAAKSAAARLSRAVRQSTIGGWLNCRLTRRGFNLFILDMAPIPTSTAIGVFVAGSILGVLGVFCCVYSIWRWKSHTLQPDTVLLTTSPNSSSYTTSQPSPPSASFTKTLPTLPRPLYELSTYEDQRHELPAHPAPKAKHWLPLWI